MEISHPGDEASVGADLSCPSPHCISHKRGIAETWDPVWGTGNNAFQVPIYRPTGTLSPTPIYLFILIIGQKESPRYSDYFVKPHYRSPSCSQPYSPVEDKRTSTPQLPAEHKPLPPFKTSKCPKLW